jgi:hypothetical protein
MINLKPSAQYEFRVKANNLLGPSNFSEVSRVTTLTEAPGQIMKVSLLEATPSSLKLDWSQPETNGSVITRYVLNINEVLREIPCPNTTFTVDKLSPSTNYNVKIRVRIWPFMRIDNI